MIDLVNVRKSFGDLEVLKDINIHIEEKEIYGIIGQSGAGKSTLLRCINGLESYDSGEIVVDGVTVNTRDKASLRNLQKRMGMIFQNFNLLPRQSALDNVGLPLQYAKVPKRHRKKRCLEVLDMVGLSDRVNFKPTQLSGGQKQRVAIARAMVNNPKILLADEPTGALDSKSGIQVMKLFRELHKKGVTIIMITHSDEIASYADRVIKIIDGELRYPEDEIRELSDIDAMINDEIDDGFEMEEYKEGNENYIQKNETISKDDKFVSDSSTVEVDNTDSSNITDNEEEQYE